MLSYYSLFLHFVPAAKTQEVKVASAASFHGQGLFSFPKRKFCPFLGGGGGGQERAFPPPPVEHVFFFTFPPLPLLLRRRKIPESNYVEIHPPASINAPAVGRAEPSLWVGYVGGLSPRRRTKDNWNKNERQVGLGRREGENVHRRRQRTGICQIFHH